MENQSWENNDLGISFSITYGRITLFRSTLKAMGLPPYFRFLLDSENRQLAIERCGYESNGSQQLPEDSSRDRYELKSMDLVRLVYRIKGIAVPNRSMVVFDLTAALRVQEGRLI